MKSLERVKLIDPRVIVVFRGVTEILREENKYSIEELEMKFRHFCEVLPELKERFERDERLLKWKTIRLAVLGNKIRNSDEEFNVIKYQICRTIVNILKKITLS